MSTRIIYMECKTGTACGTARIGRVTFNRTGRSFHYQGRVFRRIVGGGAHSNYREEMTGSEYWVSGPKRRGGDRLHRSNAPIEIDDDIREEYWRDIRKLPQHATPNV
jgi:hypothetical protein